MEPGALGRRRRRGGAFSLARLFANGEAGGVYDPSDLTAEKVAWRRNLLTWSEDFTNAAWTKLGVTITANATTAPDGTATADKLVETAATSGHGVQFSTASPPLMIGQTYRYSAFVKAAERSWFQLISTTGGVQRIWFNASTGQLGTLTGISASAVSFANEGNGWWRVSWLTVATNVNTDLYVLLSLADGDNNPYLGNVANGGFAWGAQLEVGSTATAYQRITDFTSDFLAAFPTHGLYQDAAGTTPVTALGQPVGLVIDSKTGGLANLGSNIVVNGDFTSASGWLTPGNWSIGSGVATASGAGAGYIYRTLTAVSGYRLFRVTFDVVSRTAGSVQAYVHNGTSAVFTPSVSAAGSYSFLLPHTNVNELGFLATTFNGSVDNLVIREVPGVHAIQPTSASRPLLDGRVNLLDTTVLSAGVGMTITDNAATAPDGTTRAQRITKTDATTPRYAVQSYVTASVLAGANYTVSRYFKYDGHNTDVSIEFNNTGNFGVSWQALFSIAGTGATVLLAVNCAASVVDVGNGWYRCSATFTTGTITVPGIIYLTRISGTTGVSVQTFGGDLRLTADNAYPFQFVASATNYADVGVPRSFAFDGFDDSLYTASNMDLSGTDKVTVLAGVRKLSDAALGIVAEHTASLNANNGSFWLMNGDGTVAAGPIWQYASKGTVNAFATSPSAYASPVTSVLAGLSNIAGDSVLLRVNGAQVASATSDQGTGNYANAVFYIGRRGNSSLPFNGKAYQLIVRGALTDAATLAQAERYVGAKTGLYL